LPWDYRGRQPINQCAAEKVSIFVVTGTTEKLDANPRLGCKLPSLPILIAGEIAVADCSLSKIVRVSLLAGAVLSAALAGCATIPNPFPVDALMAQSAMPPATSSAPISRLSFAEASPAVDPSLLACNSTQKEQPEKKGDGDARDQPEKKDDSDAKDQPEKKRDRDRGTLEGQAKESKPVFELRGRIQAEAALVSQSNRNSTDIGTVQDAVGFRRARLGAQGYVGDQVVWVAEFDFAGGNVAFKDVYVAVTDLPVVRELRVGNFCEPFSLEGAISSNYMAFVERSQAMPMDPQRHWGVGMFSYTDNERMTFQAGIFRSGSNNTGNDIANDNDMQYTARITALPWYDPNADGGPRLLHIGAAFSQQYALNNTITYSQGPQSNLLSVSDNPGSPFTPALTVIASQQQLYNVQAALALGPLSFQMDWDLANALQLTGGPVVFNGGYVQASYFLTGEHRDYLTKDGKFGGVQVHTPFLCQQCASGLAGGPGAWEIAARVAYTNFTSSNLPLVNGLEQGSRNTELTLGINWYLNDNTRFMFNYVHAVPVLPSLGPSFADAFFVSAQIFW
jgi:phosphate-selective porin OprO/OprP